MGVYSFLDVSCAINGPGGSIILGVGTPGTLTLAVTTEQGISEEGISVTATEDKNTMVIGADGTPMHSLHAGNPGLISIRLQKTSVVNRQLMGMFNTQRGSASLWGQNTVSIRNPVRGDDVEAVEVAFKKAPDFNNPKIAGVVEWQFDAGRITEILGDGRPIAQF